MSLSGIFPNMSERESNNELQGQANAWIYDFKDGAILKRSDWMIRKLWTMERDIPSPFGGNVHIELTEHGPWVKPVLIGDNLPEDAHLALYNPNISVDFLQSNWHILSAQALDEWPHSRISFLAQILKIDHTRPREVMYDEGYVNKQIIDGVIGYDKLTRRTFPASYRRQLTNRLRVQHKGLFPNRNDTLDKLKVALIQGLSNLSDSEQIDYLAERIFQKA